MTTEVLKTIIDAGWDVSLSQHPKEGNATDTCSGYKLEFEPGYMCGKGEVPHWVLRKGTKNTWNIVCRHTDIAFCLGYREALLKSEKNV